MILLIDIMFLYETVSIQRIFGVKTVDIEVMCFITTASVVAVLSTRLCVSWWRHQMETFSALLALCARNSPVTGEFPPQKPVTRSFDVFFDLRLNQRLSKQSWGWWFETPSRLLWRHCNAPAVYWLNRSYVSTAISLKSFSLHVICWRYTNSYRPLRMHLGNRMIVLVPVKVTMGD